MSIPPSTEGNLVVVRVMIGNWRWAGVPFMRTASALTRRSGEISRAVQEPGPSRVSRTGGGIRRHTGSSSASSRMEDPGCASTPSGQARNMAD